MHQVERFTSSSSNVTPKTQAGQNLLTHDPRDETRSNSTTAYLELAALFVVPNYTNLHEY